MQKRQVIILATVLFLFCSSVVFGFDPMGPPKATLKQGQPSVGIEYLHGNMDLKTSGTPFLPEVFIPTAQSGGFSITDIEIDKIYGTVGYGLFDNLEIFGRFGVAAADLDSGANTASFAGLIGSDTDFSIGAGARATIFEWKDISVGVLGQVSLVNLDAFSNYSRIDSFSNRVTVSTELTMIEVQLAFGPTWNCTENISIYGGPFLHFVEGHVDRDAIITSGPPPRFTDSDRLDISERGVWGGYIGATVLFCKSPNINCNVEFQATGGGYGAAIQLSISP